MNSITRSAEVIGRCRYAELRLFSLVGERSLHASLPSLSVFLSSASSAHAYRAGLFEALLPVSVGLPAASRLTVPHDKALDEFFDQIVELGDAELFVVLVDVVYRRSALDLERLLHSAASAADGPLRRALGRVMFDVALIVEESTPLRELCMADPSLTQRHAGLLNDAGGLYGPLEGDLAN